NSTHKPLLAVCEGVELENALTHLSMLLTSAFETNAQVCDKGEPRASKLAWSTWHSLELCQVLVDSILEGARKPLAGM
ncbi:hypothetical protein NL500_30280, partial [Klebsiella pneumoniae]|nr:hypothetical protein [Klebsiella pneumoniae]